MRLEKAEIASMLLTLLFVAAAVLCVLCRPGEETVHVLAAPEQTAQQEQSVGAALININSATAAQLTELPGVGDRLAERIVAYRTENGSFSSAEDIMRVSGIGQGIFDEIKGLITVN